MHHTVNQMSEMDRPFLVSCAKQIPCLGKFTAYILACGTNLLYATSHHIYLQTNEQRQDLI